MKRPEKRYITKETVCNKMRKTPKKEIYTEGGWGGKRGEGRGERGRGKRRVEKKEEEGRGEWRKRKKRGKRGEE